VNVAARGKKFLPFSHQGLRFTRRPAMEEEPSSCSRANANSGQSRSRRHDLHPDRQLTSPTAQGIESPASERIGDGVNPHGARTNLVAIDDRRVGFGLRAKASPPSSA